MLMIALVGSLTYLLKSVVESPTEEGPAAEAALAPAASGARSAAKTAGSGPAAEKATAQNGPAPAASGNTPAGKSPEAGNAPGNAPSTQAGNAPAEPVVTEPLRDDLERYVRWLRYAENERARVRLRNQNIRAKLDALESAATPAERRQQEQQVRETARLAVTAVRDLPWVLRTKRPRVPAEFRDVDRYYRGALEQEAAVTVSALEAVAENDTQRIANLRRTGAANFGVELRRANVELTKIYEGQKVDQPFQVQSTAGASMVTELIRPEKP